MSTVVPPKWTISPLEYEVFAGLDVDARKIVARFVEFGDKERGCTLPNDPQNLLNHVRNHYDGKRVAFVYEAGPTGFGLYDALTAAGQKCLVVTPAMVPVAPGNRVKTNKRDARQLARALRGGELESIRVPTGAYRELRNLTALGNLYARERSAYKCRVKQLLHQNSLVYPEHKKGCAWTKETVARLRELECTTAVRFRLNEYLDSLAESHQSALDVRKEIRRLCRADAELGESVGYLRSVPGVGWVIATHFLARLGDWRNIQNSAEVPSFVGLVPGENSTGERVRRGGITCKGDRSLRQLLIQGAWAAIRKDAELRAFFERVRERHPAQIAKQVAIVAVARKLVLRMVAVLTQRRAYEVKEA